MRAKLPDARDSVPVEDFVDADYGHAQLKGLSGKKAIEWIAVVPGEQTGAAGVIGLQRDRRKVLPLDHTVEISHQHMGGQFAAIHFDGKLPRCDGRNQNLVIGAGDHVVADFAEFLR